MELHEAITQRSMVRSFAADPVDPAVIDAIVRSALRAPSAGNTGGTAWLVLDTPRQTAAYWDATTDDEWRARSRRSEGLRRAPVVLLAYASAQAYVDRYGEPDKAPDKAPVKEPDKEPDREPDKAPDTERDKEDARLGATAAAWPVPYWIGDAAFGVMTVLLAAVDAGLGACIVGNFRGEDALARALGVPHDWRLFCAVPLGHPDGNDHPSSSLSRPRPGPEARIHHGTWGA
jgi:nitroreductase